MQYPIGALVYVVLCLMAEKGKHATGMEAFGAILWFHLQLLITAAIIWIPTIIIGRFGAKRYWWTESSAGTFGQILSLIFVGIPMVYNLFVGWKVAFNVVWKAIEGGAL